MLNWLVAVFGVYAIAWCFFGAIVIPVIALGSLKHIIFIDKQLAKDLSKYYDDYGYMRPMHQHYMSVGSRFNHYCVAYPFIRKRATTDSKKFKVFMWINALGLWSWIIVFFLAFLVKGLNVSF